MSKLILHYDYEYGVETVENAVCCHCGKVHTWDEYGCDIYQGKYLCKDCYQDYYGYCNKCGKLYKYSDMNDEIICQRCESV